jgi:hypothetical protein
MPPRQASKRSILAERIQGVALIDESVWAELKRELAPISDGYLRSLLRDSNRPMSPFVEGVHTSDLDESERTLRAIAVEYEASEPSRRKECRDLVITTKQRIRWWLQRSKAEQTSEVHIKEEILLWTATWLDNPLLFADWVSLRRKRLPIEDRTIRP